MDTAIRIKNSEGQAETLCSVVTPTTWECVQYDVDDYQDNHNHGYVADYALPHLDGKYMYSEKVEADLFDGLADTHYATVANKFRLLKEAGLLDVQAGNKTRDFWKALNSIMTSKATLTDIDYKEGAVIKTACCKRHSYYIDTGSFWGCDEELGFGNFSSGCFYNYR